MLNRIKLLMSRRKSAANLGVRFSRCASFNLPSKMVINGKEIALNMPNENGIKVAFIDLLLDDCYGCHELRRKEPQIKTILDIGGNVGLFGIAARSVFPGAIIHSYEPNRSLEPYLMSQAKFSDFKYFLEAVGLENGSISLEYHEDSVQTYSIQDDDGDISQIAFRTAIDRLGGKVDFLKMDCEGAEWDIFQDKESWTKVEHLSMEYHLVSEHTKDEVKTIIEKLGFKITLFKECSGFGLLSAERIR